MVRCFTISLIGMLFLCAGSAQAILTAGDVAIVGYNSTTRDPAFAWIALTDIQSGEVIRFTDNKWLGSEFATTNEGTIEFIAPGGGVSAGTVISMASPPGNTPPIFFLNEHGDQIIAYQDDGGTMVPLHGISYDSTGWSGNGSLTTTSLLPPGLENANAALYEVPSAAFKWATLPDGGTREQWLAAIADRDNWALKVTVIDFEPPGPINVIQPTSTQPDPGGGSSVPTPEPTTALLISLTALALVRRRMPRTDGRGNPRRSSASEAM